jgi:hypothetical protein
MAGILAASAILHSNLSVTSKCPECGKSPFIKEALPLETVAGKLTMSFLPFPEVHCSRCRTRLD